jgi:hypothetical protein
LAETEVIFERGPSPKRVALMGFLAAVVSLSALTVDDHRSDQLLNRAVPVEATIVAALLDTNSGVVRADVRFEYAGRTRMETVRLCRCTEVPTTTELMVDPKDPSRVWSRDFGLETASALGAFGLASGLCAYLALLCAWSLRRRRRRLRLGEPTETRRCFVGADALGVVDAVPDQFVIEREQPGRIYLFALRAVCVMLMLLAFAWLATSWAGALVGGPVIALVVVSGHFYRRWRRRCIAVSNRGVLVRGVRAEHDFTWGEITSARVVRRQPWRLGLSDGSRRARGAGASVLIEAELLRHDGSRIPTRMASRTSTRDSRSERTVPRNGAELLVAAWRQRQPTRAPL